MHRIGHPSDKMATASVNLRDIVPILINSLYFQRVPTGSLSSLVRLWLRVRVKFSLGVRVSGMIRVRVDVEVRVRPGY